MAMTNVEKRAMKACVVSAALGAGAGVLLGALFGRAGDGAKLGAAAGVLFGAAAQAKTEAEAAAVLPPPMNVGYLPAGY